MLHQPNGSIHNHGYSISPMDMTVGHVKGYPPVVQSRPFHGANTHESLESSHG